MARYLTAVNAVTLRLAKSDGVPAYKAGQHGLFVFDINGKRVVRTYSFHTSPDIDADLAITIRAVEDGLVSNHLLSNAIETVELEDIKGEFVVEPKPAYERHLVMFAGGSGITPLMAMIRSILFKEKRSSISLIYANQSFERIIFRQEIQALEQAFPGRLSVLHILSKDEPVHADFPVFFKGRLSRLIIKKIVKDLLAKTSVPCEFYLCGPYELMQLIEETLLSLNVDPANIFQEHFYIPDKKVAAIDVSELVSREVIIRSDGEERLLIVDGGKTILQAALDSNLRLDHACREGQCGRCRSYLLSGQVRMRKNHILSEAELKYGQILLCQGFPVSDNVIVEPIN